MPKLTPRQIKRLWLLDNPGILQKIASSLNPPVTRSAVQGVFMYTLRSRNFRIEKALADAKAPFMRELLKERESEAEELRRA